MEKKNETFKQTLEKYCKEKTYLRLVTKTKTFLTGYIVQVHDDRILFEDKFFINGFIAFDSIAELRPCVNGEVRRAREPRRET